MRHKEYMALAIFMLLSIAYHFITPKETVESIDTKQTIIIKIEGVVEKELSFSKIPTIKDVFQTLQIDNVYQFKEDVVLENKQILYIPIQKENLISLNKSSKEELMTISGIGEKTADKIINYRSIEPFYTIEDIQKIKGIGEKTYYRIRELLCI